MTTATMFLPMSWTSPLTVATSTRPALVVPSFRCASIRGCRMATAFFIVRAVLTTCGRNIFPAPNSSPTMFIPFIRGPSIMSTAWVYWHAASSRSVWR